MLTKILVFLIFILQGLTIFCYNFDVKFPVIYIDPGRNTPQGKNNTYFGYSTVLYPGDDSKDPWVQIGAPSGVDNKMIETGLVYRCHMRNKQQDFSFESCIQPFITTKGYYDDYYKNNTEFNYVNKYIKRNGAFFGGIMDVEPNSGRSIVCAPRNIFRLSVNYTLARYYMIGSCYFHENEYLNRWMLPFENEGNIKRDNRYYYGQGQVGMSAHLVKTKDDRYSELLLGAPGFTNWEGTVVVYPSYATSSKFSVPEKNPYVNHFELFGYSVNSGYFFHRDKLHYASGAPKSRNLKGQVIVFNRYYKGIYKVASVEGTQMGEYFGASLTVGDINGDFLDDLIVGAPHFSVKRDEGRVYVFLGREGHTTFEFETSIEGAVLQGTVPGGQFGLTIRSLGDLNGDGYDDIAVAAPYEEHGVVYIYNGGRGGLNPTPSQRISAKDIDASLKGFGVSLSNAADIDGNFYNDLAIGAHISGNVVLLRSQPVVKINVNARSLAHRLKYNDTMFEVEVCYNFTGKNPPQEFDIQTRIVLDPDHNRVYFIQNDEKKHQIVYKNIRLKRYKNTCNFLTFRIKNGTKDYEAPVKILFAPELPQNGGVQAEPLMIRGSTGGRNNFCKSCPLTHKRLPTPETVLEIQYALECSDDRLCISDLKTTCSFVELSDLFIIGSMNTLQLKINVENFGEASYNTRIELSLPQNIPLDSIPTNCYEPSYGNITCFVGNPLRYNNAKTVVLDLDMTHINENTKVEFVATAKSQSNDTNLKDNTCKLELNFKDDADINLIGKSDNDTYFFGNKSIVTFEHIYEIMKTGKSPVGGVELYIFVPVEIKKDLLRFITVEANCGFQGTNRNHPIENCLSETSHLQDHHFLDSKEILEATGDQELDERHHVAKRSIEETLKGFHELPKNRTLFLNCNEEHIECQVFKFQVGSFRKLVNFARFSIKMHINFTSLDPLLGYKDIVQFTTHGVLNETDGFRLRHANTSTLFLGEMKEQKVESWIIIASACVGLLLFLIVIPVLIKVGFFKRAEKEKLLSLKEAEVRQNHI